MKVYATKPTFLDDDPSKMPEKYSIWDRKKFIHTNLTSFSEKDVKNKTVKTVSDKDLVVQGFLRAGQLVEVKPKKKKAEEPKTDEPIVKDDGKPAGRRKTEK